MDSKSNIASFFFNAVLKYSSITRYRISFLFSVTGAVLLFWVDYRFSIVLFSVHLLLTLVAPYSFRLQFFLPLVYRIPGQQNNISITFDDGPDPHLTSSLLDLLNKYQVKACFFLVGEKAKQYPLLVRRMINEGHEIGNHSQTHDHLLMLRSRQRVLSEIDRCQQEFAKLGFHTYAFRPPVGVTSPTLKPVLEKLGMYCVGFSCRPRDFGNRRINRLSQKVKSSIKAGDILLLHDKRPSDHFSEDQWLFEIEQIIIDSQAKKLNIVPLSTLINRPVTVQIENQHEPDDPKHSPLDYLIGCDSIFFKEPPGNILKQIIEKTNFEAATQAKCLELTTVTNPLFLSCDRFAKESTILVTSTIKSEWLLLSHLNKAKKITNPNTFNQLDASLRNKFQQTLSISGLLLQEDIEKPLQFIFNHLEPGGQLLFALPSANLSGLILKINLALKTGLYQRLFSKAFVFGVLNRLGFTNTHLVELKKTMRSGLTVYSTTKPKTC